MYDDTTVYVVGNAKTNSDNAIMSMYKGFYIGFVVEPADGRIVDVSCLSTLRTTDEFCRSLFIGKTMRPDNRPLEEEIRQRYHGSSQRAIIVAYKDAARTLAEVQKKLLSRAEE